MKTNLGNLALVFIVLLGVINCTLHYGPAQDYYGRARSVYDLPQGTYSVLKVLSIETEDGTETYAVLRDRFDECFLVDDGDFTEADEGSSISASHQMFQPNLIKKE